MSEKPLHHQVNVVRVESVLPHPNADKLEIIPVGGFQAIAAKGQFNVGDLAYYIPPDSVVPERDEYAFVWGNKVIEGGVPEKRRRISAKKLRGEWSEGLLMPLPQLWGGALPQIGDDISDYLGITHYQPAEPGGGQSLGMESTPKKRKIKYPTTLRGWLSFIPSVFRQWRENKAHNERMAIVGALPSYDVTNFKKVKNVFKDGEEVVVTEKIHGSNARYMFAKGQMFVGSRNLWLGPGNTVWHRALADNPWIEIFCKKNPGYALYGEVVPTQKGFSYGVPEDTVRFFVFDIRTPDGLWLDYTEFNAFLGQSVLTYTAVPILYHGPYDEATVMNLVDGLTIMGMAQPHIREGVVVKTVREKRVPGVGRAQLKIVSNDYLAKG